MIYQEATSIEDTAALSKGVTCIVSKSSWYEYGRYWEFLVFKSGRADAHVYFVGMDAGLVDLQWYINITTVHGGREAGGMYLVWTKHLDLLFRHTAIIPRSPYSQAEESGNLWRALPQQE